MVAWCFVSAGVLEYARIGLSNQGNMLEATVIFRGSFQNVPATLAALSRDYFQIVHVIWASRCKSTFCSWWLLYGEISLSCYPSNRLSRYIRDARIFVYLELPMALTNEELDRGKILLTQLAILVKLLSCKVDEIMPVLLHIRQPAALKLSDAWTHTRGFLLAALRHFR